MVHKAAGSSQGIEWRITRSENNILYELDGKPALQVYKDALGSAAQKLPGSALRFPLSLRATAVDQNSLIRTIFSINEDTQSMAFAGDIPHGYCAQLMSGNLDTFD